jgi:hypothetical protein
MGLCCYFESFKAVFDTYFGSIAYLVGSITVLTWIYRLLMLANRQLVRHKLQP